METTQTTKKVFITGATGFIGSHLAELLIKKNYEVTCLVRKSSNLQWISHLPVKLVYGSIDGEETNPELKEALNNADYIYHIAGALMGFKKEDYFKVNAGGTKKLLNILKEAGAKPEKFILISSLAAGGPGKGDTLVTEDIPHNPVSWYGESKVEAEKIAMQYSEFIPITIVRPPPVYGPRDGGMLDVFKALRNGVIPVLGKGVHSNFVYVSDMVNGIVLAGESKTKSGEVFYFGDHKNISSVEFTKLIAGAINKKTRVIKIPLSVIYIAAFFSEMKIQITRKPNIFNLQKMGELKQTNWRVSIDKAKNMLGYEPLIRPEVGGKITYEWYKKQGWI